MKRILPTSMEVTAGVNEEKGRAEVQVTFEGVGTMAMDVTTATTLGLQLLQSATSASGDIAFHRAAKELGISRATVVALFAHAAEHREYPELLPS